MQSMLFIKSATYMTVTRTVNHATKNGHAQHGELFTLGRKNDTM
jgi:hypothetical protein